MVWPRVKEGSGGYHQEDVTHASSRKEKKGEAQEKMVGQYQGGHERVQDDGRHGTKSKRVERENKGRPIATLYIRSPITIVSRWSKFTFFRVVLCI